MMTIHLKIPTEKKEIFVPVIGQFPELPTGCEATALTMLLKWGGIRVSKQEVADRLPKGPGPDFHTELPIGANPEERFIGDPYSINGFGVFEKPILRMINQYAPSAAINLTGGEFSLVEKMIDHRYPVMAWVTIEMQPTYISRTWYDAEGNQIRWKAREHAVIIVGYTEQSVIVNDPYTGKKEYYERDVFIQRWVEMGRRAVSMKRIRAACVFSKSEAFYQAYFYPKWTLIGLFGLLYLYHIRGGKNVNQYKESDG